MQAQLASGLSRPRSFSGTARLVLVLALALCAGGCTKLMYNRLDTLAVWFVEGLVSLDDAQRSDLRSLLEQTLDWHRQSELTRYAAFLREIAAAAARPGNRDEYDRAEDQIDQFFDTVVARVAPAATQLLMSLSSAQVGELEASLKKKSRERSAKAQQAIARGTWHKKYADQLRRGLKRWTGTVTAEQKSLIEKAATEVEPTSSDWLESQAHWRAQLRRALTDRESPDATRKRILQLLLEPEHEWTPEYQAKSDRNRERTLNLLQTLDASLTSAQRQRLQRELLQLAEQFAALTEDGS